MPSLIMYRSSNQSKSTGLLRHRGAVCSTLLLFALQHCLFFDRRTRKRGVVYRLLCLSLTNRRVMFQGHRYEILLKNLSPLETNQRLLCSLASRWSRVNAFQYPPLTWKYLCFLVSLFCCYKLLIFLCAFFLRFGS